MGHYQWFHTPQWRIRNLLLTIIIIFFSSFENVIAEVNFFCPEGEVGKKQTYLFQQTSIKLS